MSSTPTQAVESLEQTSDDMSPADSSVPKDWQLMPLGALCSFANGVNADKQAYGEGVRFVNVLEVIAHSHLHATDIPGRVRLSKLQCEAFEVRRGDLLFNRTSETQEEVGLSAVYDDDERVVFGGFVIRGRFTSDAFNRAYSGYAFRAPIVRVQIIARGQGAIRANIGQASLGRVLVPVPSKPEQQAIAEALSDVDGLLGALEALIAKKRAIKQAAMQQLLTGKTRLPGFSGEWEVKRFGALVDRVFPKSTLSSGDGLEQGTYPLFVSGGEPKRIEFAQFRAFETLVFSDGGVFAARRAAGSFSVTDHCYVLTLNPATADMRWFEGWFSLHAQQMDRLTFKGSGLRNLDKPSLRDIEVRTPGRVEQSGIAAVLTDMDAALAALEARRDKTRQIKQGMMQQLLSGRVRLVKPEAAA